MQESARIAGFGDGRAMLEAELWFIIQIPGGAVRFTPRPTPRPRWKFVSPGVNNATSRGVGLRKWTYYGREHQRAAAGPVEVRRSLHDNADAGYVPHNTAPRL